MQKLLLYICLVLLSTRCAQITPLTGGKKDVDPPKVIRSEPENATVNFTAKEIEIQFDEYIVLKDVINQLIITPQTKELPDVEASGKKVKIKFNEELLPNTTYKLAFGNSITDLRESNILPDFQYVFSTGAVIDSMKLNGFVQNAFDKKPEGKLLVGLYPVNATDSTIYKEKPLYITRTFDDGSFKLNYLPNKPFKIVALQDQNKNLLYDGSEEKIAFNDSLVHPGDSLPVSMLLFKETPTKSFIKKSGGYDYGKTYLIYNKPQTDIKDVQASGLIHYTQNSQKDTLTLYYTNKFDTLETLVSYESKKTDTIYIKVPSKSNYDKLVKNKAIKYIVSSNLNGSIPFYQVPLFELNYPIDSKNITVERISFVEVKDSIKTNIPFTISKSEGLITTFTIQAELKQETSYRVTIDKAAFSDGGDRINDSTVFNFKTTNKDDYAQLNMKLFFPKKENYIIMLLNEKEEVVKETIVEFALTSTSEKMIEYKNLPATTYTMKVVEDANKNGHFDTGNYFLRHQPEIIFINPMPIKLLAGWEIENEWIVK